MGRFLAQNFHKEDWPDMEPEVFAEKVNGLLECIEKDTVVIMVQTESAYWTREAKIPAMYGLSPLNLFRPLTSQHSRRS